MVDTRITFSCFDFSICKMLFRAGQKDLLSGSAAGLSSCNFSYQYVLQGHAKGRVLDTMTSSGFGTGESRNLGPVLSPRAHFADFAHDRQVISRSHVVCRVALARLSNFLLRFFPLLFARRTFLLHIQHNQFIN